jgi:sec-independent protein translocase protein TatB
MDFLGIGPLELLFILVIALIVLGPRDIARFARSAGRALNRIYRSEAWGAINKASREFRDLPNRLAREAALDDLDESIRTAGKTTTKVEADGEDDLNAWKPSPKNGASANRESALTESDQSVDASPQPADGESAGPDSEPAQDD